MAEDLKQMASRAEFDLRPMCWMPLYSDSSSTNRINNNNEDFNWGLVQFVFKGKPAFSIQADGYKHERAVLAFGVSDLHAAAKNNCEDCHFIHKSTNATTARFSDIWDILIAKESFVVVDNNIECLSSFLSDTGYQGGVDGFCTSLYAGKGLWSGVYDFVTLFSLGGGDRTIAASMQYFEQNGVMNKLKLIFPGCRDCNGKMTVRKYIPPLIHLLALEETQYTTDANGILKKITIAMPVRGRAKGKEKGRGGGGDDGDAVVGEKRPKTRKTNTTINNETAMNYILLCGMLEPNNNINQHFVSNAIAFQINDINHILTWKFRYVIMWCLLQILFSAWEDARVAPLFRHHLSYVYTGIKDFYMSLLFYILHCANGFSTTSSGVPLSFEAFHFFYSSHMPFYLMDKEGNNGKLHSLSELVLNGVEFSSNEFNRGTVTADFDSLKRRMIEFWNNHYKPLSDSIHGQWLVPNTHSTFFIPPSKAMEFSLSCQNSRTMTLNVQTFNDYFSATPGYWFHFKNITMANIEKDCRVYFERSDIELVKQVWAQWYNYLCMCIQRLGIDNARGRALRSRFTLSMISSSSQPTLMRMRLSSMMPAVASSSSRWRMKKYCSGDDDDV
jgi:hypothetical protein